MAGPLVRSALPYDVLIGGRFSPENISALWTDRPRPTTPRVEELIEREWTFRLAQAARSGARLFDGRLGRYVGHEVVGRRLTLTLGPTRYRDFVGTNLYHPELAERFGWEYLSNPVGTTATLITADDYLVFGRRSGKVAYHAGFLHTFGGSLEAADLRPGGRVDVRGSLDRELQEELGLRASETATVECSGMIRDHEILQPELLFEVHLLLTRRQLLDRFAAVGDDEHLAAEACPVHPRQIVPFLRQAAPVAPVAVGAMMLFGAQRWGRGWLTEASESLCPRP